MKKLVLSLLGAAAIVMVPTSAMALDTLIPEYQVLLSRGPAQIPAGTMSFFFDLDVPGAACQYAAEWDNNAFAPLSGECFLDEAKSLGAFSCPANSTVPVASVLTLDTTSTGGPCFGFDYFQQYRQVFTLILGESAVTPQLQGVIQFTGGAPIVYGIDMHP